MKYRIVTNGKKFKVERKYWWFPFWIETGFGVLKSLEEAQNHMAWAIEIDEEIWGPYKPVKLEDQEKAGEK